MDNEIQVMNEYKSIAVELVKSELIPSSFKNPANAWYAILYGRNMGLSPIYSLCNVAVINGKPSLSAEAMLAVCKRSPEYGGIEVKSSDTECEVTLKRMYKNGVVDTTTTSFSMADAKKAGLLDAKSQMYQKYPRQMLRARAVALACRYTFGDLLAGTYSPEEITNGERDDSGKPAEIVIPQPQSTPEPAKQEHAPVSYTPIQIAQATKEANDALAKVSMTGNKVMEFRAAIKAAAADKNVEALNNLRDNILAQVKTKIEEAEYTVMPDASIDLKGKIIEIGRKLEKAYASATHMANSVRKQLAIEFEGTDWTAAVTACDCGAEKLTEALKYWEDALARSGKKAESPRDFKKEALAAIARMPEGDVKSELLAKATQEDADFEEILLMAGEKW